MTDTSNVTSLPIGVPLSFNGQEYQVKSIPDNFYFVYEYSELRLVAEELCLGNVISMDAGSKFVVVGHDQIDSPGGYDGPMTCLLPYEDLKVALETCKGIADFPLYAAHFKRLGSETESVWIIENVAKDPYLKFQVYPFKEITVHQEETAQVAKFLAISPGVALDEFAINKNFDWFEGDKRHKDVHVAAMVLCPSDGMLKPFAGFLTSRKDQETGKRKTLLQWLPIEGNNAPIRRVSGFGRRSAKLFGLEG